MAQRWHRHHSQECKARTWELGSDFICTSCLTLTIAISAGISTTLTNPSQQACSLRGSLTPSLSPPFSWRQSGTDTTGNPPVKSTVPYSNTNPWHRATKKSGSVLTIAFLGLCLHSPSFRVFLATATVLWVIGLQGPWHSSAPVGLEISSPRLEHLSGLVHTVSNTHILLPKDGQ